jgi:carbamoyltransferase
MIILGLNAFHADSAAALIRDGKLVAAAEEERFRRVKHWAGFPSQAISYCLREAGVSFRSQPCGGESGQPRQPFQEASLCRNSEARPHAHN